MSITSDLLVARFKAHTLKDFLLISGMIFSHGVRIHFTTVRRSGGLEIGNSKKSFHHQSWILQDLESKTIKILRAVIVNFEMVNNIEFRCPIRGHHVSKITWFSVGNEKLDCKKDGREEGLS